MSRGSLFKPVIVVLLLFLLIAVFGVPLSCQSASVARPIDHILLISIDTCRADYVGCYGYERETTPNIDAIAREALLFENAISSVPLTLPAHSSMLTGTTPLYHGVHDNLDYRLGQSNVTLAEVLKENGFTTGAIISAFVLDSKFGLDQGFKTYDDRFEEKHMAGSIAERRAEEATRRAVDWLAQHTDEPTFLFLHYFDPHFPYEPPEPFASRFADDRYAGEIAYTDHCIGTVIEKLKELRLYESTLLIVVGDHGEMLGEHGESTHGYFIYQSAITVPLIMRLPGQHTAERIRGPVGLIDIMPTICALLKVDPPSEVQGQALSYCLGKGARADRGRHLYCESLTPTKYNANSLLGVITDGWKYIQTTRPELYDLQNDPREVDNLALKEPDLARELRGRLQQMMEENQRRGSSDSRAELSDDDIQRLESLGYVGSASSDEDLAFDQSKEDPKDLVGFRSSHARLMDLVAAERYAQAKKLCADMLARRSDFTECYLIMARIAVAQGDVSGAVPHLHRALEIEPESVKAHTKLGTALRVAGKPNEAADHFRKALQVNPDHVEAHVNLGAMLSTRGELDEAINHFRRALAIDPDLAEAHSMLGAALSLQGKLDEAILHFRWALRIESDLAEVHHNLGSLLANQGKLDEAIRHYREALEVRPRFAEAHNQLGVALATKGEPYEALKHYREALRLQPDGLVPLNAAAWMLATHPDSNLRDPEEAIRLAERAARLTKRQDAGILDTLAAAYAAAARFDEAVATAEAAVKRASATGAHQLAAEFRARIQLYRQGKPFRESIPSSLPSQP